MTEPTPSAERREEVRALWNQYGARPIDLFGDRWTDAHNVGCDVWSFIAALDALAESRARAEVEAVREQARAEIRSWREFYANEVGEEMRERAAVLVLIDDCVSSSQAEELCEKIRALPIKGDAS